MKPSFKYKRGKSVKKDMQRRERERETDRQRETEIKKREREGMGWGCKRHERDAMFKSKVS